VASYIVSDLPSYRRKRNAPREIADLIIERSSDQPRQVDENVALFMSALYEAIILVVVVSWLGFWEWRYALLMAISIPLTLAMTFGMIHVFRY
jgi:multidrug efflux pump